ncbi:MAG: hypothetical protein IJN92_01335 [Lachnospiraceae bacterium]|nr:hypothetical protein [Lachnospiraceae bacterium]
MAFMAMVLVAIFGIICLFFLVLMLVFLILGIVKAKKKKKSAKVFFILSGTIFAAMTVFFLFLFGPRIRTIVTPDKTVKVGQWVTDDLMESIENEDIVQVDKMLSKRPELIYYVDINGEGILDEAALTGNVELVQCILKHGAKFDDELVHEGSVYKYSLEYYFHNLLIDNMNDELNTKEIASMVECMMENGASATFVGDNNEPNALWVALWWITQDDEISDDDMKVMKLLIEYGASCTEENYQGDTVLNLLDNEILSKEVMENDPQGFTKLRNLLQSGDNSTEETEIE